MMNERLNNMNPIETAVAPLKNDAMDRAEQYARDVVALVERDLIAAGNDLNVCAPYPSAWNVSREEFMRKESRYKLFRTLCHSRVASRSSKDPNFADVTPENVAHFVETTREDAAFQYDAFVAKLVKKIGAVVTATLEGNHVWSYSHLTVTKADDTREVWKTSTILNVSKLGKVFNQFPTRKVKR